MKLFEDRATDNDIIRSIIDEGHESTQESFCILDVADVMRKHQNWIAKMPKVIPHYGNVNSFHLRF